MNARVSAKPQRKRAGFSASANGCRRQRQGRGPCGQADDGATDSPPRECRQGGGITTLRECAHPTRRNDVATLKPRQRRGGGRGATGTVAASGAVDLLHRGLAKPETRRGSAGDWSPPAGDGRSRADDPAGTDGEPKVACSVSSFVFPVSGFYPCSCCTTSLSRSPAPAG